MNTSPGYPICDSLETQEHLIFGCTWIKFVWFRIIGMWVDSVGESLIGDCLKLRRSKLTLTKRQCEEMWMLSMFTCSFIYKAQCKCAFKNKPLNLKVVSRDIHNAYVEYLNLSNRTMLIKQERVYARWLGAPATTILINNDASWCVVSKQAGIRMVVRDHNNKYLHKLNRRMRSEGYPTCNWEKMGQFQDWIGLPHRHQQN